MELDDLKNTWNNLNNQVTLNQNFNIKQFDKMNKLKFQSSLNKILLPEIIGTIVCVGFAIYIGYHFEKLDTITYQIIGIVTILLLLILSVISLMSILPLYKVADLNKSYSETLMDFATKKISFRKLQKLNLLLSYLLLVAVILLSTRLFGRNEITDSKYFFVFTFSFAFSFFLIFTKWVIKNYKKSIRKTEDLLKELTA
ncbi:MAG: hypothetical protein ABIO56_13480 [Ferruginibacter sp.]